MTPVFHCMAEQNKNIMESSVVLPGQTTATGKGAILYIPHINSKITDWTWHNTDVRHLLSKAEYHQHMNASVRDSLSSWQPERAAFITTPSQTRKMGPVLCCDNVLKIIKIHEWSLNMKLKWAWHAECKVQTLFYGIRKNTNDKMLLFHKFFTMPKSFLLVIRYIFCSK